MYQWVLSPLFCIFLISYLNRSGILPNSTLHAALIKKHCSKETEMRYMIQQAVFLSLFLCLHSREIPLLTQSIAFRQQSFLLGLWMKLVFVTQVFSRILVIKDKILRANDGFEWGLTSLGWASLLCQFGFTGGAHRFQAHCLGPLQNVALQSCRFCSFDTWTSQFSLPL